MTIRPISSLSSLLVVVAVAVVGCGDDTADPSATSSATATSSTGTASSGAGGAGSGTDGAGSGTGGTGSGTGGAGTGTGGTGGAAGSEGGSAGTAGGTAGSTGASGGAAGAADAGVDARGGAGGTTSDGGVSNDAPSGDGGVTGCNALVPSGAQIAKTTHAGAAPAMTGGDIALGTYVLTAMDKYNGTTGSNTKRETWVFSAGHVEIAGEDSQSSTVTRASGSFTVAGNVATVTLTCPGAGVLTSQYTATSTQLMLLSEPLSSDMEVHILTKQ
jgi:hypothetical protein